MSDGYTKLFASIIHSTVWQEPPHVKIVWVTMLAMADQHGEVQASVPGLAKASGVDIAQCEEALSKFMSPDPYSRTKEHEGRRVQEIDGGWFLLNHEKYRHTMSYEHHKAKAAERQRRYREKKVTLRDVTDVTRDASNYIAEAKAEEEAKEETTTKKSAPKAQRRKWTDVDAYTDATREVVNALMPIWPKKQPDETAINCDQFKMADRVQELLSNKALTPAMLIEGAKQYLDTHPKKFKAPQFFFGPGQGDEQPAWRPYVAAQYRSKASNQ